MAAEKPDKAVQFVAKLVQLTQDNELRWESAPNPKEGTDRSASAAFTTQIDGSRLRTYKVNREVRRESPFTTGGRPTTIRVVLLEVLDDFDQVTYTFSGITGLTDLYESASFSASKVNELMDSVLRRK